MLTDGVDRYYDTAIVDDPYVDVGKPRRSKEWRGRLFHLSAWSRLLWPERTGHEFRSVTSREVSEETGGYAYFEGFSDPVTIRALPDRFSRAAR